MVKFVKVMFVDCMFDSSEKDDQDIQVCFSICSQTLLYKEFLKIIVEFRRIKLILKETQIKIKF